MKKVCPLKSTSSAINTHDYSVEGTDKYSCPVHLKLLRHHLATGGAIPAITTLVLLQIIIIIITDLADGGYDNSLVFDGCVTCFSIWLSL